MSNFQKMISTHKAMIEKEYAAVCDYMQTTAKNHDNDKTEEGYVKGIYEEHFPTLKTFEFGSKEYKQYEQAHFKEAHRQHVQNRHHFYSVDNTQEDTDLFDLLEAIIDIRLSQRQYSNYDIDVIMQTFKNKGVLDLNIEELARNTLLKLEQISETSPTD
ncbi:DUF5662 family protein [Mollicutes bacterium LVI A0039]|nr:DUF5662 family protein [Mollicutes bacterium LVI A0039]